MMPKKKNPQTAEEQAEHFRREAQKLADAGSLTLIEGETGLDAFVRSAGGGKRGSPKKQKNHH
jgi:hypothetical protein